MTGPGRPISEDDLHALVDGRLDAARHAEVERYLAANPEESRRMAAWASGTDALRSALAFKLREPVPPRLDLRRLAQAHGEVRRWGTSAMAASVALALCLGAGGGWMARRPGRAHGVTVLAREALAAHQLLAPGGVQRVDWPDTGLAGRIAAPDLSAAGYVLRERQPVVTDEGVGQILIYAGVRGQRISLFIRPMQRRDMTEPMQPVSGAPGWAWATDGLGVSVISSEPVPTLRDLAETVRRRLRL